MAVGAGSLWGTFATSANDAGVQRVDPATGQVVASITIPYGVLMRFGLGNALGRPGRVNRVGRGRASQAEARQALPDRPHHQSGAGPAGPLPGIAPTALAVGEGAVWVGELDRKTLTRFNLVS